MYRPHPNECSGSDLDGDLYFLSWDEALVPASADSPMDYCPPGQVSLDHPVTVEASPYPMYSLDDPCLPIGVGISNFLHLHTTPPIYHIPQCLFHHHKECCRAVFCLIFLRGGGVCRRFRSFL
jgi:hypothetical protein